MWMQWSRTPPRMVNEVPTTDKKCSVGRRKEEECEPVHRYTDPTVMGFMCKKHQQWIYEVPVKVVTYYADGTEYVRK